MWNGTRIMAEKIASGIKDTDKEVNVKPFNLAKTDKNDVITEIFKSKAILVGSPSRPISDMVWLSHKFNELIFGSYCRYQ
jgi:flavorubredoxin